MNEPTQPKPIAKLPADQTLRKLIHDVSISESYIKVPYFRNQLLILKEEVAKHKLALSQKELAFIFNTSVNTIKHQLDKAKKEKEGEILSNGRPFTLTQDEIKMLRDWVQSGIKPPMVSEVKAFIEENFEKRITDYHTMQLALQKSGLKTEYADPMDADRYYADQNKINYYYSLLGSFCNTNEIPSHFILNVDEEGHEDYSDSKKQMVVVSEDAKGPFNYPVKRSNNHTTFLACITADGSFLNPLIVIKRKTLEARMFRCPIADKIFISENESGYITSEIFDDWATNVLVPYIQNKRKELKYTGPAVLIMDGCSCHYTPKVYRLCSENQIKLFFLPPHSSNQTQPLDLVVFHLHKDAIRKLIKIDSDDSQIIDKIEALYSAFQSIATLKSIKGSFEATGAVYESSHSVLPILHFDQNFATHLLSNPKSKKEKKELSLKRKGLHLQDHESRIRVEDIQSFWKNENTEKISAIMDKVPKIVDPSRDAPSDPFHRLLQAFVPCSAVQNDQFYPEQPKGRPKKQQIETSGKQAGNPGEQVENQNELKASDNGKPYTEKSFFDRLMCELQYVGIYDTE